MSDDIMNLSNEGPSSATSVAARPSCNITRYGNAESRPSSTTGGTITSLRVASPSGSGSSSGHTARHSPKDSAGVDCSLVKSPAGAVGAGGSYSSSSRSMTASRRASVTERHVTERSHGHKRTASGNVGAAWSAEALGLASPATAAANTAPHNRYHHVLSYSNRRSNAATASVANEHSNNHIGYMPSSPNASPRLSKIPSHKVLKHADAHPTILGAEQQEKQQEAEEKPAQLAAEGRHADMLGSGGAEAAASAAAVAGEMAAEMAAEVVAAVRSSSLSAHASFKQTSDTPAAAESIVGSAEAERSPLLPVPHSLDPPSAAATTEAASPSQALTSVSASPKKEHSSRLWGLASPKKEKSKVFSNEASPAKEKNNTRPWVSDHLNKDKSSNGTGSGAGLTKKDSKNKLWSSDAAARAVASLLGSDGLNSLKKSLSGSSRSALLAAAATGADEDSTGSVDGAPQAAVPCSVKDSTDCDANDSMQLLALADSSSNGMAIGQATAVEAVQTEQASTAALQVVAISVATLPAAAEDTLEHASTAAAAVCTVAAQPVPPSLSSPCSAATAAATEAPGTASHQGTNEAAAASSGLVGTSGDHRYSELLFRLQQFLPALKGPAPRGVEDFEATWELLKGEMTGLVSTAKTASLQAGRLEVLDAEVMQLQRLLVEVGSSIRSGAQKQQLQHLVQSFPSFARRQIESSTASPDANSSGLRAAGPLMSPAVKITSKFPAALNSVAAKSTSQLEHAPASAATMVYGGDRTASKISQAAQGSRYSRVSGLMGDAVGSSRHRSPGVAQGGMTAAGRSSSPSLVRPVVLPPVPKELTPDEAAQLAQLYRAVRSDPERIACRTLRVPPRSRSLSPTHPDRDSSHNRSSSARFSPTRRSAAAASAANPTLKQFSQNGQQSALHSTESEPASGYAEVLSVARGFRVVNSIPEAHRKTGLSAADGVRRDEGIRSSLTGTGHGQAPGPVSPARRTSSPDRLPTGGHRATRGRRAGADSRTGIARLSGNCSPLTSQEPTHPGLVKRGSASAKVKQAEGFVVAPDAGEASALLTSSVSSIEGMGYEYVRARSASPNLGMHYIDRSPILKRNKSPVTAARRRDVGSANPVSCSLGSIPISGAGISAVERYQAVVSYSSDRLGSLKAAFPGSAGVSVLGDDTAFRRACHAFQEQYECGALRSSIIDTLAGSSKLAAKLSSSPVKDADSTQVAAAMRRLTSQLQEHGVSLDITRLGPLVYSVAGRKLRLRMLNGILLVRTGGGCVDLLAALGKLPTGGKFSSTTSSPLNSHSVANDDDRTSYLATSTAASEVVSMMTTHADGTAHGLGDSESNSATLNMSKAAVLSHHLGRLTLEHVPDDSEVLLAPNEMVGRKCEGGELGCEALPLAVSVGGDAWADIVADAAAATAQLV